ncbi:MAG: SAM-dependent methyltransferase [Bacteroidia bacterium]
MSRILHLIPNTLGESPIENALPPLVIDVVRKLKYFVVENEKSARKFLKMCGVMPPFEGIEMYILDKHSLQQDMFGILKLLKEHEVGVLSEAGCPAIADPGADLVLLAHEQGMQIRPYVGPSSILLALMGAGFNGQGFTFNGYLPVPQQERISKLKELEALSSQNSHTQVFIETPFRNEALLTDIIKNCAPETFLSVSCNLTLPDQKIISKPVAKWQITDVELRSKPAVFCLWRRPMQEKKSKYANAKNRDFTS